MKRLAIVLLLCCGLLVVGLTLVLPGPVGAQDDVGNAAATIAMATARAEATRASFFATDQANRLEATVQAQNATATAQAQSALATQGVMDEMNRQRAATATAGAMQATVDALGATATADAINATATAQAQSARATATAVLQSQSTQATRDAIDAEATRQLYTLAYQQSQEQAQLGRVMLYAVAVLALAGCAWVLFALARSAARRLEPGPLTPKVAPTTTTPAPASGGMVVDMTPNPLLPSPTARMPGGVRMVDNPALGARIEAWFYGSDEVDDDNR